jgi:hypothetical protein
MEQQQQRHPANNSQAVPAPAPGAPPVYTVGMFEAKGGGGGGGGGGANDPATTTLPLSTPASEGDTIVSWNIGLRGLRQLVDSSRSSDKVAAKDEHGVSRQLGYGSIGNLLDSLGPSVRVVGLVQVESHSLKAA